MFFNQPFRAEQLTFETQVRISGTPKLAGLRWEFTHPQYEIVQEGELPDEDAPGRINSGELPADRRDQAIGFAAVGLVRW
ncbi:hypothetical protein [Rhodopirellula europaea]|uniref:hypothetical protein n=1 Tax=Rhodopirellula europaea TaxID=1263866 RepID=UPI003D2E1FDC